MDDSEPLKERVEKARRAMLTNDEAIITFLRGEEPTLWDGRRVYDAQTGVYLGRAVGEPYDDGVEGLINLRQDEEGQGIRSTALCGYTRLGPVGE